MVRTCFLLFLLLSSGLLARGQSLSVIAEFDRKADSMKLAIRTTPSDYTEKRRAYYVSPEGNDARNGRSPQRAVRSLDRVNTLALKAGDVVLFERDGLWRGVLQTKEGVTYSAYGSGEKPRLYGSPCDAAEEGRWYETGTPNVYVYDRELPDDIGTLVFNHGESCALKVMKAENRDLKHDLEFLHDYLGTKRLYLYSSEGNPAQRFNSIELLVKTNVVYAKSDVVIDNLCIKYCGAHGIGSGTLRGLTVTNCELGWIGGSIQGENLFGRSFPTRYGNAIEVYGGCDSFRVDHCYIYQVYDAAITHQYSTGGNNHVVQKNITYTNNLVEDCTYSIEYFLGKADNAAERYMDNVVIRDNLLRRAGFGWGQQRPDKDTPAHIQSWTHHRNQASRFVIENNVFDRATEKLLKIAADKPEWLPALRGNTYIESSGISVDTLGSGRSR